MSKSSKAGLIETLQDFIRSKGGRCAIPVYLLMLIGFIAPLVMVAGFSVATPRTFKAFTSFTLENFTAMFQGSVWTSFAWSIGLAAFTTALLVPICYPVAVAMVRVLGPKCSALVSILFVFPMFVSENVRLYGWILFFMKKGILDGTMQLLNGNGPDVLYTPGMTAFGLIYSYLPYMLFPVVLGVAMVPRDLITAARDLGSSRFRTWREIELPLAMPGVLIGMLLTFVLSAGAISESKIVGGESVMVVTNEIDIAFSYSQNWPSGAALAVVLTLIIGGLTIFAFSKLDLDRILGRS